MEVHKIDYRQRVYQGTLDAVRQVIIATMLVIDSYNGETIGEPWISDRDEYVAGATPSTGAQVAYTLDEPLEIPVAVSNLPIRTLSGYNRIESSTGEMEIEYITENYQPLVDLIQSSKHVYSTQEQVVGKWIDGRDLYERTVVVTNPVYTGARTTIDDPTFTNCEIVSFNGYFTRSVTSLSGAKIKYPIGETESSDYYTKLYFDEYLGTLAYAVKFDVQPCTEICIIVRYTKTTTTRSLNASVNAQKSISEPLTDKTEEVPTKEENEEENTNDER